LPIEVGNTHERNGYVTTWLVGKEKMDIELLVDPAASVNLEVGNFETVPAAGRMQVKSRDSTGTVRNAKKLILFS
jgi:hypothetical protein